MGLLQNGYRLNLTGKLLGAFTLWGGNPYTQVYQGHRAAANRNMLAGEGITDNKAAVPNGNLHPSAWILPRRGGNMSSRASSIAFITAGAGLMGMPGAGTSAFTISFADAFGQLIASGAGVASFSFVTNNPALTASVSGAGSSSFAVTGSGTLGALASLIGATSFTLSGAGAILPEDDTSPLRTASAGISFSGSLVRYALGNMAGSTDVSTELTNDSIAAAVWNTPGASFNDVGTMGNKLNTASSGGVDLNALADAVWSHAAAIELSDTTIFLLKVVTNKKVLVKVGEEWVLKIYDDNGTTEILSKALKDKDGNNISDIAAGVLAQELASDV